jgi:hypothetical protein
VDYARAVYRGGFGFRGVETAASLSRERFEAKYLYATARPSYPYQMGGLGLVALLRCRADP